VIANDIFTATFGIVPNGDDEYLVQVARAGVRNGFAIVLNRPGTKEPMCTLSARQAKNADRIAQEMARDAGRAGWERKRHDCGIAHAITDPNAVTTIVKRVIAERGAVNLGVEVGLSNMLVIDVDTAAEKAAFLADWSAAAGEDMSTRTPTVVSPGKVKVTDAGEEKWVHKDGGHYWFSLPDGVNLANLPGPGRLKGEGGWVAIWRSTQVLTPPSVRAEGPYRLTGTVEPAPGWLLDRIRILAEAHVERARQQRERVVYENDPIDGWSAETPWAELLAPDGWTATGLPDGCDCPIWTRPGDASHHKSATAHELGCTKYDLAQGHGPLYLWTDNPPEPLAEAVRQTGKRAITKLQYVAWRDHGGSMGEAMRVLELAALGGTPFDDLFTTATNATNAAGSQSDAPPDQGEPDETVWPAADDIDEPPATEPAEQPPGVEEVQAPQEYLDFKATLDSEPLPGWLRKGVGEQWVREFTLSTYRRLRDQAITENIAARIDAGTDRLADIGEDTDEDLWRFEGLWMQGQKVMLTAKYKAGKTTMVLNVVKSLVDGTPFLGRFAATPLAEGSVFIVNAEMTKRQFNRWLAFDGPQITNRDRVFAMHVREVGPGSGDIMNAACRDALVAKLNACDARVLVLDPLNPLFGAAGIDEDKSSQVGPWFNALDEILGRTSVSEVLLVHHFGHTGQRGRGSSKLMDHPDALWTYTKDDEPEDPDDQGDELLGLVEPVTAPRYLQAIGRDVDLPKSLVTFDKATKTLTLAATSNGAPMGTTAAKKAAHDRKLAALVARVVRIVGEKAGITSNALQTVIGGNAQEFRAARDEALRSGQIVNKGASNRMVLYPIEEAASATN
jgi:hypothetical protein